MILDETRWRPLPDGTGEESYYDPGDQVVAFRGLRGRLFVAAVVTVHTRGLIDMSGFRNVHVGPAPTIEQMAGPWGAMLGSFYNYDPENVRTVLSRHRP